MVSSPPTHGLVRAAGIAAGLLLAVALLLGWRLPAPSGALGADARFVAVPPGELEVSPGGDFLSARGLTPGGAAPHGRLDVRNLTAGPVDVRVRGLPSNRDVDRLLRVELRGGERTLSTGPLASIRRWSRGTLRVPRGGRRTIEARAWLPRSAARGWEARSVDVTIELRARVVR